ncbi:MAG: cysteine desulfurase NifS [Clostridia bacterium]|nr:cysteine desulfurase NifS [Clostridia bacterium]
MKKIIYMDNAATTAVSQEALETMMPFFRENFGNPSTIYSVGRNAKKELEIARERVAKALGASPKEIFFTSCGTESDNWAIKGAAFEGLKKGKNHIITSKIEHHAVLHTVQYLEKKGFDVTYLDVDSQGLVNPKDVENAITEKTALVTIMYANNEIGTIEPIEEIGKICKDKGVLFHTDAVQAVGHVPIDVKKQNIDMLSLSAHKFHGPKGIGALYIRKGVRIETFMEGGAQESGKRAGTENTAEIAALGKAIETACTEIEEKNSKLIKKRDKLISELLKIERSRLNGHREKRLPGNVNISFEGIEGESLLLLLDMAGICASSGSACTSGSLDPSHVLLAIGLPHEIAHGSLRLSLDESNTDEEIDFVIAEVSKAVKRLRDMSPLWEKIIKENK